MKNIRYPYKIIEDIIQGVDRDLNKLETEIVIFSERLTEQDLELFNVLVKMVKNYSELIKEQNDLILIFHKLLILMKPYVISKEKNRRKDEKHPNYNKKLPDMEFVYKDIILEMLNSIKNKDNYEDLFIVTHPKNQQHLINEYKLLKTSLYSTLEKRSKNGKEKIDEMNLETFNYGKNKNSKSQFSW